MMIFSGRENNNQIEYIIVLLKDCLWGFMGIFRFVHVSDIHFGQEREGNIQIHDDVRDELLRDSESFRGKHGGATGILVTGDIAFSGKPAQYTIAGEWLDKLSEITGCEKTSVFVVPGNHDIDLDKLGKTGKILHKSIRESPLDNLEDLFESILVENGDNCPLFSKLTSYMEFSERYGCNFRPRSPYWVKDLQIDENIFLNFHGLTTVLVSDKEDAKGAMILGNKQYIIARQNNTEFIILMHHPLEWFRDKAQAKNYLNRAKIILTGHEHCLKVDPEISSSTQTLWIVSGATNSPDGDDPYQYRYNWIEFFLENIPTSPILHVKLFPRIWNSEQTGFVPDSILTNGEEFLEYNIPCTNLIPTSSEEVNTYKNLTTTPEPEAIQEVQQMAQESIERHEGPYIKLRYLFWKYLNWDERLSVLVKLDLLPSQVEQPIPQTLERLALEKAQDEGKLSQLWDSIMNFVPEDEKSQNPF